LKRIGESKYDTLRQKRLSIDKFDWDEEADRLRSIAEKEGLV